MGKLVCSEICEDEGSVLDIKSLLMILPEKFLHLFARSVVYLLSSSIFVSSNITGSIKGSPDFQRKDRQSCSPFLDITIEESLFYATGAAMAVGILGDVQWMKVCNFFGGICR
ncbi:hypothetical protein V6N12_001951 [Hibiscus sabdariffa]|uniref:Uncharacterized protein n=1 Tax=Hibiscus sabdariffa TaxID=183260 RepID=A0ABR2BRX2_9ROSI